MLRILAAALVLVVGVAEARDRRCRHARTSRTKDCASYAFFEFAPASGAGMTEACSCTSPTGARGEALTFTRTGAATCSKKGLATTGIANGDLVVCASNNQPRVEPDADGVLGLRVEAARTNSLLRSDELTVSPWADVGTPTVTDGATSPFGTATADTIDDNDAVAYEGRSQAVTVTSGAAYTLACYLKAGTASSARLLIDGTAINATSLSSTTWTRAEIADAAASSTSITVQVLVGDVTSVTGTVIFGGCDVQNGTYATAYIPTTSAAATRNAESASLTFASTFSNVNGSSLAGNISFPSGWTATPFDGLGSPYADAANRNQAYWQTSNAITCSHISSGGNRDATVSGSTPGTASQRMSCAQGAIGSGTLTATRNGVSGTPVALGTATAFTAIDWRGIGGLSTAAAASSIVSRLCYDPDASRCR